jgi:hypothetical protein
VGADRLLVCSFYFYYTPERRICQGLFLWKIEPVCPAAEITLVSKKSGLHFHRPDF